MTEMVEIVEGTPSPEEYAAFRAHVRWPAVDPAQAADGLRASLASVVARDVDGALVGMGRVVGDGGVYLYLQDVIVLRGLARARHRHAASPRRCSTTCASWAAPARSSG